MFSIQGIVLLLIGFITFIRFLHSHPSHEEDDNQELISSGSNKNVKKAISLVYSDGWQEVFTALFLLVWVVIMMLPYLNNYLLYAALIINPLLLSYILTTIRKTRTFLLTMELTDMRIDLMSFVSVFSFFFLLSLGIFIILSLRNVYETRQLLSFLPSILAISVGFYYLIYSRKYSISRYKFYALVFVLIGILAFLLIKSAFYKLIFILAIPAIFLFIQGFRKRVKAR